MTGLQHSSNTSLKSSSPLLLLLLLLLPLLFSRPSRHHLVQRW
jgi:hypothetical protein